MLKKISLVLLTTCISASSYAYVIGANLTVQNKTDVPMEIEITPPNKQEKVIKQIPAHETIHTYIENGDHSGWLYQTSTAPFTIKANNKLYAQGRIAFYVGASVGNKYSFLNAVSAADGIKVDPSYSCKNGGNGTTFENTIVIDGTPGNAMSVTEFPDDVSCQGIKSSVYNKDDNQDYTITCSDDTYSTFHQLTYTECVRFGCWWVYKYSNGEQKYWPTSPERFADSFAFQRELDKRIGSGFCGTW